MQSNQSEINNIVVINNDIYDKITSLLMEKNFRNFSNYMYKISQLYNIDMKSIIKDYYNYLIRYDNSAIINSKMLTIFETIFHNSEINIDYLLNYIFNVTPQHIKI